MTPKDKRRAKNSARDPVSLAAQRALRQRMDAVLYYHPLAAQCPEEDVEYVHQLRVACRRGVASINIFVPLLGQSKAAKLKKRLRRIRKSADDARDLDVLLLQLGEDSDASGFQRQPYFDALKSWRDKSQNSIVSCFERAQRKDLAKRMQRLTRSVRWHGSDGEQTLEIFARDAFEPCFQRLLKRASGDLANFDRLHRLRIEAKKVRYAMELLAAGFPKSFRVELYPQVEELQDKLGRINDYATANRRFARWLQRLPRATSAWEKLAREQTELAVHAAAEFLAWWTAERISALQATWYSIRD